MFLKSLELVGFKSFVNKTHLEFHEGITSVVGPNGCGKSNILDSIRWCLGEQSAKALRGGEMADVIFSGTDSRAAVGMAEVSMTFSGCADHLGTEWEEVRITRRIFRDGKGEYLLNKTPCRLRDIHELFMDTGIGRSSYSIMEQGKIDLILSSRPEDRRAVFEEAAGITKFKSQKKEALRKLQYTEANLVRVSDIMREVKRHIGSLQRQAGKARRYQALSDDLRVLELHFVSRQYEDLQSSQQGYAEDLLSLETRGNATAAALEEGEGAVIGHRTRLTELEEQVESSRQAMQALRDKMVQAQSRASHNEESSLQLRETIARCQSETSAASERQRVQREEMGRTDEEMAKVALELAERAAGLDALQARLRESAGRRASSKQSLETLRSEVSKAENESLRLQGELASLEARREASLKRMASLEQEAQQLLGQESGSRQRLEGITGKLQAGAESWQEAERGLDAAEAAVEARELDRQKVESEISVAQQAVAQIQSRLEVLEQLNLEGEGATPGAQAVLKGLDRPEHFRPAVRGMLGNLLEVESGFLSAIEAALGAIGETIVLNDKASAPEILQSLYDHKLGRASLVTLPDNDRPKEGLAPEGSLGWASARVVGEAEDLQRLAGAVLHGIALATSLEHAVALRQKYPSVAFATQHGELIDVAGIVTGGRAGEGFRSALERRDEIVSLGARLKLLQSELAACESVRLETLAARDKSKESLESAKALLRQSQNDLADLRAKHSILERELQETVNRTKSLGREKEHAGEDLAAVGRRVAQVSEGMARCREQAESAETRCAVALTEAQREANEEEAAGEQFNELRVEVAAARQREEGLQAQRAPMLSRIEELEETMRQRGQEKSVAENRVLSIKDQTEQLEKDATELQAQLEAGKQNLDALQSERSGLHAEVESADERLREQRRAQGEIQEQRGRIEVKIVELKIKLENLQEDIRRRYQVELGDVKLDVYGLRCAVRDHRKRQKLPVNNSGDGSSAKENGVTLPGDSGSGISDTETKKEVAIDPPDQEILDWGEIEVFVTELRDKLDRMGPVNIEAIQEFDDLLERQTFLDQQFTDLTNSKDELLEVIKKINDTTTLLFAETFGRIRDNFRETFKELFGGGKSDLALSDEGDPLESGIEIIAKPPGKQLQSVSLLSGGERTMTAVALLFAIYMVKPSPFCILDEMDAPLDESNINRFLAMLDRFVQQSQFLVITHNKRTIARADVLYGVTMEERGISKLVGVKFTDASKKSTKEESTELQKSKLEPAKL